MAVAEPPIGTATERTLSAQTHDIMARQRVVTRTVDQARLSILFMNMLWMCPISVPGESSRAGSRFPLMSSVCKRGSACAILHTAPQSPTSVYPRSNDSSPARRGVRVLC